MISAQARPDSGRTLATSELSVVLRRYVSGITARSMVDLATSRAGVRGDRILPSQAQGLLRELEAGLRIFVRSPSAQAECLQRLRSILDGRPPSIAPASPRSVLVPIHVEPDIITARRSGSDLCRELGFGEIMQTKIATAISELARNIIHYAGHGEVSLRSLLSPRRGIEVVASDQGPGIPNLQEVLSGAYRSRRGLGMGLRGTRSLVDEFDVTTRPGETRVTLRAYVR